MPHSERANKDALRALRPVRIAVGGLPSPNSMLLIHVVGDILRRVHGAANIVPFNTLPSDEQVAFATSLEPLLVYFDVPNRGVAEFIACGDIPYLIALETYERAVVYSMVARGLGMIESVRFVSQASACLEPLMLHPRAAKVAMKSECGFHAWLDELAEIIGCRANDWESVRAKMHQDYSHLSTLGDAFIGLIHRAEEADRHEVDVRDRLVIERLAEAYNQERKNSVFWPSNVLLSGAPPYAAVDGTLDLCGPARALTFGPYLHLPAGVWTGVYSFEALGQASDNLYLFDVIADGEIKFSTQGPISVPGKYAVRCEFAVEDPTCPVEFRCLLMEGAIDGQFTPLGVNFRRNGVDSVAGGGERERVRGAV